MSELWVVSCDFVDYWGAYAPKNFKVVVVEEMSGDSIVLLNSNSLCP